LSNPATYQKDAQKERIWWKHCRPLRGDNDQ